MYDWVKLIKVYHSDEYGVFVIKRECGEFWRLLYLEITDCESVNIWIIQDLGAVLIADNIATSSALKEHSQYLICA